jgi:hypothetical protein
MDIYQFSIDKNTLKNTTGSKSGSVANIYKDQAALICGQNHPAKAINCL